MKFAYVAAEKARGEYKVTELCRGVTGTPKGRTRRTIPMTPTLYEALRVLEVVREGYVVLDHIGRGETGRAKCEENVGEARRERREALGCGTASKPTPRCSA